MKLAIVFLLAMVQSCQSAEVVPVMTVKAGGVKYHVFEIEGHRYISARADGSPFIHAGSCKCFSDSTRCK